MSELARSASSPYVDGPYPRAVRLQPQLTIEVDENKPGGPGDGPAVLVLEPVPLPLVASGDGNGVRRPVLLPPSWHGVGVGEPLQAGVPAGRLGHRPMVSLRGDRSNRTMVAAPGLQAERGHAAVSAPVAGVVVSTLLGVVAWLGCR